MEVAITLNIEHKRIFDASMDWKHYCHFTMRSKDPVNRYMEIDPHTTMENDLENTHFHVMEGDTIVFNAVVLAYKADSSLSLRAEVIEKNYESGDQVFDGVPTQDPEPDDPISGGPINKLKQDTVAGLPPGSTLTEKFNLRFIVWDNNQGNQNYPGKAHPIIDPKITVHSVIHQ